MITNLEGRERSVAEAKDSKWQMIVGKWSNMNAKKGSLEFGNLKRHR